MWRNLQMYKLPTISTLLSFTKLRWKNIGQRAVSQYWSEKLREEAAYKSTLINCNLAEMNIGRSYVVLDNVSNNITDVKRGIAIAQGKVADWFVLQTTKSRFSQHEVNRYAHSVCWLLKAFHICSWDVQPSPRLGDPCSPPSDYCWSVISDHLGGYPTLVHRLSACVWTVPI